MKLTIELQGTPPRTSDVIIGEGLLAEVKGSLSSYIGDRSAYWIWDENVWHIWGKRAHSLGWPGEGSGRLILFPASEANKRLRLLEDLASRLVQAGADRHSVLVAVGGGVTGDVTGFLASIYMRGIDVFQIPTSLLAQVDSSVGGKTGVDLPEGKNLLGTFHQPRAVWMDPVFLETLPPEELRQGMAEVIKTALIGDEVLWKFLENSWPAIRRRERDALLRVISACCILKARVVQADETESGRRRVLNLGHTVGHALEKVSNYRIRHGDAVALGMIAAARLSVRLGKYSEGDLERLERLCEAWEFPSRIPATHSPEDILEALKADKKRIQGTLHFILPISIGDVADVSDINDRDLKEILISLKR